MLSFFLSLSPLPLPGSQCLQQRNRSLKIGLARGNGLFGGDTVSLYASRRKLMTCGEPDRFIPIVQSTARFGRNLIISINLRLRCDSSLRLLSHTIGRRVSALKFGTNNFEYMYTTSSDFGNYLFMSKSDQKNLLCSHCRIYFYAELQIVTLISTA